MPEPKKQSSPRKTGLRRSHLRLKLARAVNRTSPVKAFETKKSTPNLKVKTVKAKTKPQGKKKQYIMASNRHLGRIIVLQSLYEYEFRSQAGDKATDLDVIIAKNIEPYSKALGDTEFVYDLAHGVADKISDLDKQLQPLAPEWPINTIASVDRNVLRMGLYELACCGDAVPPKVAINEAVELAKAFGSDNSSRFVNGVLGTAYRQIYEKETPDGSSKAKAASKGKAKAEA